MTVKAFVDTEGRAIATEVLPRHLRGISRVAINAEFNDPLCHGLQSVRYDEAAPQLIHFVRRRLPADACQV